LKLAPNLLMLDSGCLWGGTLTAIRLDDRRVYQVPGRSGVSPKPSG
jgi:bis(5'-nucleosyl)-tetraphosphatase (symmetrical)